MHHYACSDWKDFFQKSLSVRLKISGKSKGNISNGIGNI